MDNYLQAKRELIESAIKKKVGTTSPEEINRHVRCEFSSDYSSERYFYDDELFFEIELILKLDFAIIKSNNYIDK